MRFKGQRQDPDTGAVVKEGTPEYVNVAVRDLESLVNQIRRNELALQEAVERLIETVEGLTGQGRAPGPPDFGGSLTKAREELEKMVV